MAKFIVYAGIVALVASVAQASFEDCLKQDSIACIQKTIYRKAKEFFEKDSLEILPGVSVVKAKSDRASRSNKLVLYDQEIEVANANVQQRQAAIENFVKEEAGDFIGGRSLKVNFAPALEKIGQTARAITSGIPQEIEDAANQIAEGRARNKKLIKNILPLLLIAKAKVGLIGTFLYFAIALLTKKAIIISLISIALSAFLGLRGLFFGAKGLVGGPQTTAYNAPTYAAAPAGVTGYPAGAAANTWTSGAATGAAQAWEDGQAAQYTGSQGYH